MRKIIVLSFITLDGVMQAPGRPDEDASSDFKYGGWCAPFFYEADEAAGVFMAKRMKSADLGKHSGFLLPTGLNMQTCGRVSMRLPNMS
ncbi:MAG TPA: hypothetical protein VIH57_05855 [Bacteroidales bacterium]